MKYTKLILFLFCCFLAESVDAQRFRAGAVAGVNLSQLDGDDLAGFHKLGAIAGLKVNTILSDRWELSTALLYSQQGSSASTNDPAGAALDKVQLNFVEVPVMINFNDWKFQVGAGLAYNRLIDYTAEDVFGDDVTDVQNYDENIFSVVIGGTFNFDEHWGLNVRWSKYLNNMQAEDGAGRLIGRTISIAAIYSL